MAKTKKELKMPAIKPASRPFLMRVVARTLIPLVRLSFGLQYEGIEKLPKKGAYVLVANHVTNVDALAVAYFVYAKVKRGPHFLAKEGLFRTPIIGWFLRNAGQIPVYRSTYRNDEPLRAARDYLKAGHVITIFPEGTLTRDPELWPMRGRSGAIRLAIETGVPVYYMAHWGSEKILPQYDNRFRPGFWKKVRIIVGGEVNLDKYRGRELGNKEVAEATDVVIGKITELVAQLRGETPPAKPWSPLEHGQPEHGNFKKGDK